MSKDSTRHGWLARWTVADAVSRNLFDEPATGPAAWARTSAGVLALLLTLQLLTGVLLAFYYVPSDGSAHATVAFMEKALAGGSFLRSLHFYGSQLLPLAIILHLAQLFWRGAHRRKPIGWLFNVCLLSLVLANGATGYSLPWDARAYFSTQVAGNIAGGFPFIGEYARAWLIGGSEISTLTLSRFYALHILIVPMAILLIVVARLFMFKEPTPPLTSTLTATDTKFVRTQITRNAVVIGIFFFILSLYASTHPAPLGPSTEAAPVGYLPRPGVQFRWLFQLLKYSSTTSGSLLALFVPGLLLGALALLPFITAKFEKAGRGIGLAVFASITLLVAGLTSLSYLEDAGDQRIYERLAEQARQEEEFRNAPFVPLRQTQDARGSDAADGKERSVQSQPEEKQAGSLPPAAFRNHCARCHGESGEGHSIYPPLINISRQPNRTTQDIIAIINNPTSYGLEKRMPSFASKLTEEEKRAIAEWVASL